MKYLNETVKPLIEEYDQALNPCPTRLLYRVFKANIHSIPGTIIDTFDLQFYILEDMLDLIKYEIIYDQKSKTFHIRSLCGSYYMSLKDAISLYNSGDVIPDKYKYIQNINFIRNKKSPTGLSVTSNLVKLLR